MFLKSKIPTFLVSIFLIISSQFVNAQSVGNDIDMCKQLLSPEYFFIGGKFTGPYGGDLALYYTNGSSQISGYYEVGGRQPYYRANLTASTCDGKSGHIVIHWEKNEHSGDIEGTIVPSGTEPNTIKLIRGVIDGREITLSSLQLVERLRQ